MGNVGYYTAKILQEEDGAKIVGILEYNGALLDPNGLNVDEVYNHKVAHQSLKGYPGATYVEDSKPLLEEACDILIPAAMEGQITAENAERINTKLIVEAANGPITPTVSPRPISRLMPRRMCTAPASLLSCKCTS